MQSSRSQGFELKNLPAIMDQSPFVFVYFCQPEKCNDLADKNEKGLIVRRTGYISDELTKIGPIFPNSKLL